MIPNRRDERHQTNNKDERMLAAIRVKDRRQQSQVRSRRNGDLKLCLPSHGVQEVGKDGCSTERSLAPTDFLGKRDSKKLARREEIKNLQNQSTPCSKPDQICAKR